MAVVVEEAGRVEAAAGPVTLPWPIPFEYSSILFGLKSSAPPFFFFGDAAFLGCFGDAAFFFVAVLVLAADLRFLGAMVAC